MVRILGLLSLVLATAATIVTSPVSMRAQTPTPFASSLCRENEKSRRRHQCEERDEVMPSQTMLDIGI
jgi:hypothetical protein